MSQITGITRNGTEWVPAFVTELDQEKCIGCGRCFNVCPRAVFSLVERSASNSEDEFDDDDFFGDDDDDDGFSDDTSMVMSLKDEGDCIGCGSCSRVCPKSCLTHEAAAA